MSLPASSEFVVSRSAEGKDRGRHYVVKIDGEEVARLRPAESVALAASQGQHVLSVALDQSASCEMTIDLKPGEHRKFVVTNGDLSRLGSSWIEISEA